MTSSRPKVGSSKPPVKNVRSDVGAIAIGAGTNSRIRTQAMWLVKGHIRVRNEPYYTEWRISAVTKDAAIERAHARYMTVKTCAELKQKPK